MPEATHVLRFGPFHLYPAQRTLMEGNKPLRVGSRSFDLLVALCERPGEVVPNQALLASAWPNRVVEEGSLRVHIGALRKVLGDGEGGRRYITNVPLRGYCFVAPVEALTGPGVGVEPPPPPSPTVPMRDAGLPRPAPAMTRLVGRERETTELLQRLRERRCITLVGPGGIGKTSVALRVARQLGETEGYEVVMVELAALAAPELVPMAMASALGIVVPATEPLPAITAFLRDRTRLLIVLDNCEHVIDAVAAAAERVLTQAPGVQLLSTSREALRIQGEWVQRLGSLSLPPTDVHMSAAEALQFPAVQLFVERAAAGAGTFEMTDADTPQICALCRRLDGIPLAIELAAAAVDMVGVSGLADGLGSRLALLGRGRRTALPRHQTLRATLDWSHDLLSADEQDLLVCLSVFRNAFTHAAAVAVFDRPLSALDDSLSGLVAKSLLATDLIGDAMVYRLLETTREYAGERLAGSSMARDVARRHALYMQTLLRQAETERNEHAQATWAIAHARWVDDLRAAVNWAFSPEGDPCLGISLMAWSAPLWFALSKMAEYRGLAERALAIIDASGGGEVDAEEEMRLCEALGHALWHTRGGGVAMATSFRRALAIAERLHATPYRLRCLWGLWLICNTVGDYAGSRGLALQFGEIAAAAAEPGAQLTHERMMSLGMHFHGDQGVARHHAQRVLEHPLTINHTARNSGFQFDQRVAALTVMSRVLWMQGLPEQALRHADEAVEEALSIDHALSLCYAIANGAAPVAFWSGDRIRTRNWTTLLRQRADERSLYFWQAFADVFQLMIHREDGVETSHAILSSPAVGTLLRETLCTVRPEFADEALFARAKSGASGWCTAELLRVAGERSLAVGDLATAESHFLSGIEVSRQQQALSWELRCSTSLARAWHQGGAPAKARDMLAGVLQRFQEGFDTQDLCAARALVQGGLE
jgi:predicted ATPase/DNA-binding winged helix-turn-helix (wHTH) protein